MDPWVLASVGEVFGLPQSATNHPRLSTLWVIGTEIAGLLTMKPEVGAD